MPPLPTESLGVCAGPALTAYIGLGANLGDAQAALRSARVALEALPRTRLLAFSSLYRSAPMDSSGPDYVNAVAALCTELTAAELLASLQSIEGQHGRQRAYRNAPRTLDLDLLLFADQRIDTPELQVPHPRLHERAFVLAPLTEIAPELQVPGRSIVHELLRACTDQRIEKLPT